MLFMVVSLPVTSSYLVGKRTFHVSKMHHVDSMFQRHKFCLRKYKYAIMLFYLSFHVARLLSTVFYGSFSPANPP